MRVRTERDYYAILGVAQTATDDEIKHAFRRLALRHHPDRNPGDRRAEERFKEISEAYAVLMDPRRRGEYDSLRHPRAAGTGTGAGPGSRSGAGRPRWQEEELFRDLFSDPRAASVFEDLAREWARMGLRFDEAFVRDLFFHGRGAIVIGPLGIRWVGRFGPRARVERDREGASRTAAGEAVASRPGFLGWLWGRAKDVLGAPLRALAGNDAPPRDGSRRGDLDYEIALAPDDLREGGRFRLHVERAGRREELLVSVPAGLRPGTRLRLRGKGEPGADGTPGDLFLHVREKA